MVSDPGLALAIRGQGGVRWGQIEPLLTVFWERVSARVERRHRAGRLKQWLNLLRRRHPEAQDAFDELRLVNDPAAVDAWLLRARRDAPTTTEPIPALPAELGQPC